MRARLRGLIDVPDTTAAANAIRPLHDLVWPYAAQAGLDNEQISELVWNAYAPSVSNTKVASKMRAFEQDPTSWEDIMVILRNREIEFVPKWPSFSKWRINCVFTVLSVLVSVSTFVPNSGRFQLLLVAAATALWMVTGWWTLHGFHFGGVIAYIPHVEERAVIEVDAESVVSSSAQLRVES